jgi:hypothetical protein
MKMGIHFPTHMCTLYSTDDAQTMSNDARGPVQQSSRRACKPFSGRAGRLVDGQAVRS